MGCSQSITHQLLKNRDEKYIEIDKYRPDFIKEQYHQHQIERKHLFLGKSKICIIVDDDDSDEMIVMIMM
jgi:hypothetical protein